MWERQHEGRATGIDRARYGHLDIQEGGMASQEYPRVHFSDMPEAEHQRVRRQLEEYCGLDTLGMIWIVEALERMCG